MIINIYIPESDSRLIEKIKSISGQKRRSFSFVIREALEHYLLNHETGVRDDEPNKKKEGKGEKES